jgi:hypothetical protein
MSIKSHFTSRWGSEGVLAEFDWTGLEIAGWAFLTQDPKLLELLNSGRDMHRYVGSMVLGKPESEITDAERKHLKQPNFTLIYGGTDYNLVTKDGLDPDFAKQVYDTFWALFPTARAWSDGLMKEVDRNAFYTTEFNKEGRKELWGWYQGITGRKFYFKAYESKISSFCAENRIYSPRGFKYSEVMNYQCQSFCTADIHMIALGNLFREAIKHRDLPCDRCKGTGRKDEFLLSNPPKAVNCDYCQGSGKYSKFLLINTVHDSVLCDIKVDFLDQSVIMIKQSMEEVKDILKNKFNIILNVPLSVEGKMGKSWAELSKIDLININNEVFRNG